VIVKEVDCKSLLAKSKLPDADYVINPYIGCNHGCVYCYAQFMRRFTGHSDDAWGGFIDVKRGGQHKKVNLKGKSVLIGSVTDPYNPLEKKYRAMRSVLLSVKDSGAHVEILTKSPLVLDDIDLLQQIPDISVGISLSTADEQFARLTEPHAPSPQKRIDAVYKLREAGIPVYLFVSPIFPYLSGWKAVVDAVGGVADLICFENLNLRANYRSDTMRLIEENYPDSYPQFSSLYSNKAQLRAYWEAEADKIGKYMQGKNHKIYFFHSEIKKK
jgi:DNA repair photolyase